MTTQTRLGTGGDISTPGVRKMTSAPLVAPKPKYNPLANRSPKPFTPMYTRDEDLPPPPPDAYSYTNNSPNTSAVPQNFPPPPPLPGSIVTEQSSAWTPITASYQQKTTSRPTFTVNSNTSVGSTTSQPLQKSTSGGVGVASVQGYQQTEKSPLVQSTSHMTSLQPSSASQVDGARKPFTSYMTSSRSASNQQVQPAPAPAPAHHMTSSYPSANLPKGGSTSYMPMHQSSVKQSSAMYSSGLDDLYPDIPAPMSRSSMEQPMRSPEKSTKEAEVDALTNMLVQNLDASSDPKFYGMCVKCSSPVKGTDSGCTALDQTYHVMCFTCHVCSKQLRGTTFYSVENNPHCESCYLNTLEKCSVCSKPITERLLKATGKPYHPSCFTCVACGVSLDGIPFTVDSSNQIFCIEDFHRKFAPRCCVCQLPIMPLPGRDEAIRVVAMDKSFHVECYKCEDCGMVLSSEAEGCGCYPLDEHILCKNCNATRIQAMTSKMTTEL